VTPVFEGLRRHDLVGCARGGVAGAAGAAAVAAAAAEKYPRLHCYRSLSDWRVHCQLRVGDVQAHAAGFGVTSEVKAGLAVSVLAVESE